ncbi:MAG: YceI family protein [Bacteroidota bacterium]
MHKIIPVLIFLLLAVKTTFAQKGMFLCRAGKVIFISEAPLEIIKASSDKLQGVIDPVKHTFAFSIPTESFKGFNSPLQQEHFYENYLEAKAFPYSKFEGKIIEQLDFSHDGIYTIRAKGKLILHGVEQERIIKVKLRITKGVIYADSAFTVLLQDHDITIPRVVYQKIAEEIKVTVYAEFVNSP